jgi:hypothetical protein
LDRLHEGPGGGANMSEKNYLDPEQNPFIKLDPVSEADKLPA